MAVVADGQREAGAGGEGGGREVHEEREMEGMDGEREHGEKEEEEEVVVVVVVVVVVEQKIVCKGGW
jgi:hypothetical protein